MDKKSIVFVFSKNKSKLTSGLYYRALNSPFRSIKEKRSLNNTRAHPIALKLISSSNMRTKIYPRAFLSDNYEFHNIAKVSSTDLNDPLNSISVLEESGNKIRTPSTVHDKEHLNDESIEESLFSYFNNDYKNTSKTPVPMQTNKHRYQTSLPCELTPFRTDTPKIPTRDKGQKEEVKLPAVDLKGKGTKGRSPSPQEKKNKVGNCYFQRFRSPGVVRNVRLGK